MIICRAFNRAKGPLPLFFFEALVATPTWSDLMKRWAAQAAAEPDNIEALNGLLWPKKQRCRDGRVSELDAGTLTRACSRPTSPS